jgi:large subunit ribosomal protein L31e
MPAESYVVPLKRAYEKPRTRRSNVAVKEIFDFLYKHTRRKKEDIVITNEVNEFVWKRGIQKPPRKISISLKENSGKLYVFLKDSKQIVDFFNKKSPVKESKSIKEKVLEMKENIQNPKSKETKEEVEDKKYKPIKEKDVSKKVEEKNVEQVDNTEKIKTADKKETNTNNVKETSDSKKEEKK